MSFLYPAPVVTTRRISDYTGKIETVKDILASNLLHIPHYQRSYKWGKETIQELMDDIFLIMKMDNLSGKPVGKTHMLTNMVLHEESQEDGSVICNIVDGQQRITTIFMILIVLMRELRLLQEKTDNPDAVRLMIQMEELIYCNLTGPDYTPRLSHMYPSQAVAFKKVADLSLPLQELPKNTPMGKAPSIISQYMREHFGSLYNAKIGPKTPLPFNFIHHLFTVTTNGLEMDVQRTKLAEAAQRAYSNLNSKGQELDGFEIIKNVLAGSMDADIFVQHWENLEKALAGSDAEQKQDLFFKTWLISRDPHSASAAKKVDKQFFHLLSMETIGAGQDTLIEMIEDAHRYTQHSLGKSQQKDVDGLFWLNQSGTQHRPFILAAKSLEKNDPKAFSLLCEELSRTIVVMQSSGVRPNSMSKLWRKWTTSIAGVHNREDLEMFLNDTLRVERDSFADGLPEHLLHLGSKTSWRANGRPVNTLMNTAISFLAYHIQKMSGHSKSACAFMETATLEHIVPVRSGHNVTSPITEGDFRNKVAHLGNLTVMNAAENSSASNRPVAEKIALYESCPIVLTQAGVRDLPAANSKGKAAKILRNIPRIDDNFNLDTIEDRGLALAHLMAQTLLGE